MNAKISFFAVFGVGVLAGFGQEPVHLPWVGLLAVAAGFLLIAQAQGPRSAFWRGWAFGCGYFATTLHWIVEPFLVDVARYGWMAPFAVVLLAGGLALFWGAGACAATALAGPKASVLRSTVALALWFTAFEMLRAVLFTGFPWAMIGTIWVGSPVAQSASFWGAHGLNLLTFGAAAGLAAWGAARGKGGLAFVIGVVPMTVVFGLGMMQLSGNPEQNAGADRPIIRLIQPNAPQDQKWLREMIPVFWQRKLALTSAPSKSGRAPDLVIWPEVTIPYLLGNGPQGDLEVAQAAGRAPVIVGAQRLDESGLYNALAVIQPDGAVGEVYDKHHLVPFGEYFPGGALAERLGLRGLATLGPGGFSAGPGPRVLDLSAYGLGQALPLICYEAIFPRHARTPGTRPDWIVQITNDAWFGEFAGPQQHLAQARLRSIETGLPMVRVANTGISALIDPFGRLSAQIPLGQEGFLDVALPEPRPITTYARFGNWPIVLILLSAGVLIGRKTHRHR